MVIYKPQLDIPNLRFDTPNLQEVIPRSLDSAWQNLYTQVAEAETLEKLEKAIELCERFSAAISFNNISSSYSYEL